MNNIKDISIADLQACRIYIGEQIDYWEKVDTAKDEQEEKEHQEIFNMWSTRYDIIDDELAGRIELIFKQ